MFITQFKNQGKTILLRADLDVPLKKSQVADDTRLHFLFPTLKYLLNLNSQIIILAHLGRPGGKKVTALSLQPLAHRLQQLLKQPVNFLPDLPPTFQPQSAITLLENLRFYSGEETNQSQFAQKLAHLGEVYVNDAFATAHRRHASIVNLPQQLPSFLGLHFKQELKALDQVAKHPRHPLIFVLGGAKLKTKLPLIKKLAPQADQLLLGGLLGQKARKIPAIKKITNLTIAKTRPDVQDITLQSAHQFRHHILQAGTVVWNGPLGIYEQTATAQGTKIIAQAINQTSAYTVIGGGDTEAAATKFKAQSHLNHISSGGGAMLVYLATSTLPALKAIKNSC